MTAANTQAADPNVGAPSRKKLNAEVLKLSDEDVGFSFKGKLMGESDRPWTDPKTGEVKNIHQYLFEKDNGERVVVFGDGGLNNVMNAACIEKGAKIEIVKLGQKDISGSRRVNQYDIFEAK